MLVDIRVSNDGKRYVITKAHDLSILPKYGSKLSELYGKPYRPSKTFCHPFLNTSDEKKSFTNIGIIKLSDPIPVSTNIRHPLSSVELIIEGFQFEHPYQGVTVAGWGTRNPSQPEQMSEDLMDLYMNIKRDCPKSLFYRPSAHLYTNRPEGTSICYGDFGGPAVVYIGLSYGNDPRRPYLADVMSHIESKHCGFVSNLSIV